VKKYQFDYTQHLDRLIPLLKELNDLQSLSKDGVAKIFKKYPNSQGEVFSFSQILNAYHALAGQQQIGPKKPEVLSILKKKPGRTSSGVTPVTILTKPFPCPGKCIFCPSDVRMPKSYLSDEPGAQRAERNYFDPYLQTTSRLEALQSIGHNIDKVEIIILGGTWSFYPESYQIWFIKECFRALNEYGHIDGYETVEKVYQQIETQLSDLRNFKLNNNPADNDQEIKKMGLELKGEKLLNTYNHLISKYYLAPEKISGSDQYQQASWEQLYLEQKKNETADCRCVGLVIETRPDHISQAEVIRVRKLGCTKTQIGVQSLSDSVLSMNHRGHDVAATRKAFKLLRQAGFKIHAHWMANLYGSSVKADQQDYLKLFSDPDFCPDELKIYPCSLIESAELMKYYQQGLWQPYSQSELTEVIEFCLKNTPEYCRLTRIIRDIPSTSIVVGNKKTNFRQITEQKMNKEKIFSQDIRSREIKDQSFDLNKVRLEVAEYQTSVSTELFLQFVVDLKDRPNTILAFLRLSLPKEPSFISELKESAIIREIHVYGPAVAIGKKDSHKAQHGGFGTKLIAQAVKIAQDHQFHKLNVISSIGTREYYRKQGFQDGDLYQYLEI